MASQDGKPRWQSCVLGFFAQYLFSVCFPLHRSLCHLLHRLSPTPTKHLGTARELQAHGIDHTYLAERLFCLLQTVLSHFSILSDATSISSQSNSSAMVRCCKYNFGHGMTVWLRNWESRLLGLTPGLTHSNPQSLTNCSSGFIQIARASRERLLPPLRAQPLRHRTAGPSRQCGDEPRLSFESCILLVPALSLAIVTCAPSQYREQRGL